MAVTDTMSDNVTDRTRPGTPVTVHSRISLALSGALFLVGAVLALRAQSAVYGVDVAMLGAGAMLAGLFGITLSSLIWAARGPGAVQDTYAGQVARRHRHRIGRT